MSQRPLRATALLACLGAVLATSACTSDRDDIIVSPLPPGVALREIEDADQGARRLDTTEDLAGARLDEVLAVVEGEPLRLRALARRLGIPREEASDEQYQQEIAAEIKKWAVERLFQKAAEREGIEIPASRLDAYLDDLMKGQLEKASEDLGSPVTEAEFLESEGVTYNEWRDRMRGQLLEELYVLRLSRGLSGTRPQVDLKVDPAEIRRFYRRVPELSRIPKGVRLALFEVTYEQLDPEQSGDFEVTEAKAIAMAKQIADAFRAGETPEGIAQRFRLGEAGERWGLQPPGKNEEAFWPLEAIPDPKIEAWVEEPGRRPRDARVMTASSTGVGVIGLLAVREAEVKTLADPELYDAIERAIQSQRLANLRNRLLIKMLRRGRVVWPERLADEIQDEARDGLRKQRETPELRGLRLR